MRETSSRIKAKASPLDMLLPKGLPQAGNRMFGLGWHFWRYKPKNNETLGMGLH